MVLTKTVDNLTKERDEFWHPLELCVQCSQSDVQDLLVVKSLADLRISYRGGYRFIKWCRFLKCKLMLDTNIVED